MVKFLIQEKANFQAKNFAGENLLLTAAKFGSKSLVKFFLNKGIDIDSVTNDNSTALLIAIESRNPDAFHFLLKSKANINVANSTGPSSLLSAIKQSYTDLSSKLLLSGADIDQVTSENSSVLHFALQYDDRNVVSYLLKQNLKVNRRNHLGQNELHFAARYGDEQVIEFLIKQGMNVNETSINQSTPLHYVTLNSRYHKEAVVEKLLKYGAKVDVEDKNGNTVLNLICKLESYTGNIMEKLLGKGADPNHRNKNGVSPLFSSILNNQSHVATLIKYGGNINQVNDNDDNALHIIIKHKVGCACSRISFENRVIKLGAKLNGVNKDNQTPLLACLEYDSFYEGLIEIENLIDKGAQMAKNKDGEIVFHLSKKKDKKELVEYFFEKGVDIHDETSSSVFHYVAKYTKNKEILELLLTKSTHLVHCGDGEDRTSLHIAALQGSNELIETLLKYGAEIDSKDKYRDTPINYAIKGGHLQTVKLLLKNGASTTTRNNKGLTALVLAEQDKNKHIYQCLLLS